LVLFHKKEKEKKRHTHSPPFLLIVDSQKLLPELEAEYFQVLEEVLSKGPEKRPDDGQCNKEEHPE
jgi:hypothetical protein